MIVMGVRKYVDINFIFEKFLFSFLCFNDITRLSTSWFTKDEFLQMYFSGLLPVFKEHLYQDTPSFCVLLAES